MKKAELREYVSRLSDENLLFLHSRFTQRLVGDLPEALEFISKTPEMDRWFSSAGSSEEFYVMVDELNEYIEREKKKRDELVKA
jgi:tripartite-type tricarboxylate transporter receptor subunit TctC